MRAAGEQTTPLMFPLKAWPQEHRSWPLALGGHIHMREVVTYQGSRTRFAQGAAVVGPGEAAGFRMPSGITLYRVRNREVDDGTFVPL